MSSSVIVVARAANGDIFLPGLVYATHGTDGETMWWIKHHINPKKAIPASSVLCACLTCWLSIRAPSISWVAKDCLFFRTISLEPLCKILEMDPWCCGRNVPFTFHNHSGLEKTPPILSVEIQVSLSQRCAMDSNSICQAAQVHRGRGSLHCGPLID